MPSSPVSPVDAEPILGWNVINFGYGYYVVGYVTSIAQDKKSYACFYSDINSGVIRFTIRSLGKDRFLPLENTVK